MTARAAPRRLAPGGGDRSGIESGLEPLSSLSETVAAGRFHNSFKRSHYVQPVSTRKEPQ